LTESVVKFAALFAIFGILIPSISGLILASFAGVFLVAYETHKENIDPFISTHIGAVAGTPAIILSIALMITSTGASQLATAGFIGVIYTMMYPILYAVYSNIGKNIFD
jgi:hypothetical protein